MDQEAHPLPLYPAAISSASSARVVLSMGRFKIRRLEVGIDLRGDQTRVSEHFLYRA